MKKKSPSRSPLCNLRVPICLALLCTTSISVRATTITVTNTNDSGPGSLRQALADANDGDTIDFAVTGTIGLTSGELLVDKSITISGPGAENLAVNGNAKDRVFHIASGQNLTISSLTMINGYTAGFDDRIHNDHAGLTRLLVRRAAPTPTPTPTATPGQNVTIAGLTITNGYTTGYGGGIHNNHAALTLSNCTVTGNSSSSNKGGGIYNDAETMGNATLVINNCLIINNPGGGIYNNAEGGGGATLQITSSTLSNNSSGYAIYSHGFLCIFCGHGTATVQITDSSITDNSGGAIYSDTGQLGPTTVSLTNSTVSGNAGAAVHNSVEATTAVSNSTISGNTEGGIYTDFGAPTGGSSVVNSTMSDNYVEIWNGAAYIKDTIFEVSPGGHSIVSDGSSTIQSFGYNLSNDDGGGYLTGPGDQINTDPLLGPLQDNGGPTFTHALLLGSPAINAGDPNFVPPPDYDQRGPGYDRVRNGRLDIGSFEVQAKPTPTPTPRPTSTPRPRPTPRVRPTPR